MILPTVLTEKENKPQESRSILRATFILGSSSVMQMVLTIIRTKVLAVLLGPAGVGLAGLLTNLMSTAAILFDLGTGTSATRSVAEAHSKNDKEAVGRIRTVVTLLSIILGAAGCATVFFAARPLAVSVLGNGDQAYLVRIVSLGILFTITAGVQRAFINGMRRIGDMARVTVIGNLLGTITSIAIAWQFREEGIVYYVITVPLITLLVTLFFLYKIKAPHLAVRSDDFRKQAGVILKLGIPLMFGGLMTNAVMLTVRGRISTTFGLETVGLFQVAWAITDVYIGFVLNAMIREYYPRLSSMVDSPEQTNQAVNNQAIMALWLTTPFLLGIVTFAPLMVQILYSSDFLPVVDTLRWMALGTVLKIVTWAMGFIWLAQGKGEYVLADAILWNLFFATGVFFGLESAGIVGIGWIFTTTYLLAIAYTRLFVGKITGFKLQWSVIIETSVLFFSCLLCIALNHWLEKTPALIIGTIVFTLFSARAIYQLYMSYISKK